MKKWFHRWISPIPLFMAALSGAVSSTYAATRYVSPMGNDTNASFTTWSAAARTIQAAVNKSAAGDIIIVTNGAYFITSQIAITNQLTINSVNGPAATFIYGSAADRCLYLTANASVSGFTITNGVAESGGGIYFSGLGTVSNCVIAGNRATGSGGGIFMAGGGTLIASQLADNSAAFDGGGAVISNGGTLVNCTITRNSACNTLRTNQFGGGGGVFISGGTLVKCSVSANHCALGGDGGGVYILKSGSMTNCVINANHASTDRYGGGVLLDQGGWLYRCIIQENIADNEGGGIYVDRGGELWDSVVADNLAGAHGGGAFVNSGTLKNCTIIRNQTTDISSQGAGIYSDAGIFINCVIYNNIADGAPEDTGGLSTTYTNCCTPTAIGASPLTNDPAIIRRKGEYHLASNSPCINRGTGRLTTDKDIDGQSRKLGGAVEIGADEYAAPLSNFAARAGGPYTGSDGQSLTFNGSSSSTGSLGGNPLLFSWDFGDNSIPTPWTTSALASYAYSFPGVFTGSLIVLNDRAMDVSSFIATITNQPPSISLSASTSAYAYEPVSFAVSSSSGGAYSLKYAFKVDSNWTAWNVQTSISYTFDVTGTTNVYAAVGKFLGVEDGEPVIASTTSVGVAVLQGLTVLAGGPYAGGEAQNIAVNASVQGGSGTARSFRFDPGDGTGWSSWAATGSFNHAYATNSPSPFILTVAVSNGVVTRTATASMNITNLPPIITSLLLPSEIWLASPCTSTGAAIDPGGDAIDFLWTIDGQQISSSASGSFTWTPTNPMPNVLQLIAKDSEGAMSQPRTLPFEPISSKAIGITAATPDRYSLAWRVVTNRTYSIQRTTNLLTSSWSNIVEVITTGADTISYMDTNNLGAAYYKAVLLP